MTLPLIRDGLTQPAEHPLEVYRDALEEFNTAGLTSGADACEHYLACLAELALFDFRQRWALDAGTKIPKGTE